MDRSKSQEDSLRIVLQAAEPARILLPAERELGARRKAERARLTGESGNLCRMGITASVVEKAIVDSLMKLAEKTETPVSRQAVIDLLCWSRRRGFLASTQDVYNNETWKKVGEDLWESVQVGTKGVKTLARTTVLRRRLPFFL